VVAAALVAFVLGAGAGAAGASWARSDDGAGAAAPATTVPAATSTAPSAATSTTATPTTTAPPSSTVPPATVPGGTPDWLAMAGALAPVVQLPSDCPLPLDVPESLPNSSRAYRGGVHEGIDFICGERGRSAVAALDGQVLIADASYVDPEPAERQEVLDVAKSLGYTPPWTLAMLFGRFVVLDHGVRPGVGHVVTIYAHLEQIDPAIRPGLHVKAGQRLGEIGNRGTESAGTGEVRPQAIHLHWELHIDDRFLGQGLSAADTSDVYRRLFGR
jgi:murein DD-endopeptidase MepM/ murein hydrolase activator NlpD